jgi:hypothetical protein
MAAIVAVLAGLHICYMHFRPDPFIGPVTGALTASIWGGLVAAVAALAGLRTGRTLIDASLARADQTLGINAPAVVSWLARHAPIDLLNIAYMSAVPLVFISIFLLGILRRADRMWELSGSFAGAAMFCAFFNALIPAAGTFAQPAMTADIRAMLPQG